MESVKAFWSLPPEAAFAAVHGAPAGLSGEEAERRLREHGPNRLTREKGGGALRRFLSQFKSPITLMLLFATAVSAALGEFADSLIILLILLASALLGYFQERNAGNAVEKLQAIVRVTARVRRDGAEAEIPVEDLVPGDVVLLAAGDMVPADLLLLSANALSVDESTLTGETFPAEKTPGVLPKDTPLARRANALFMGTHVISGSGEALAVNTGAATAFGALAARLNAPEGETDFERGVRKFGNLLMEVTVMMLLSIFIINLLLKKPAFDSLLFSLALAVGMTPQLLPAIISVNLARGARDMARSKVIVKKLSVIENFGTMSVLCSDKTGTVTVGRAEVSLAADAEGQPSETAALLAWLNASFQSGYRNPVDEAVLRGVPRDTSGYVKRGEIPYDFVNKRLSVLLSCPASFPLGAGDFLIAKGALAKILDACGTLREPGGAVVPLEPALEGIQARFERLSAQGLRVLGLAYKPLAGGIEGETGEEGLTFLGFLGLFDPLKPGIRDTVAELGRLGVGLKIITGDNRFIAANIASQLGLSPEGSVNGGELEALGDGALVARAEKAQLFCEIEPNQKERILLALKKTGRVVGYMGDGINDAAALRAADVGVSVNTAADVAKDAASIVLLEQDLGVLVSGVKAGRHTFANTMKYVFMATSANFGNMFSMAGASLFLPFLPLRPTQVLLNNLLTDVPEMQIAADRVDEAMLSRSERFDIGFIRRFMLVFGTLSSVFDYLTFALLMWVFRADEAVFQTGWFTESILSAAAIVFVMRTRLPFYKSRPGRGLLLATLLVFALTLALPYTPLAGFLGLSPLPPALLLAILGVVAAYLLSGEALKRHFFRREARRTA